MGGYYKIFGRQVPSYQLSIATFAAMGLIAVAASSGGKKSDPTKPPINASSSEEEKFILDYLKKAESEQK